MPSEIQLSDGIFNQTLLTGLQFQTGQFSSIRIQIGDWTGSHPAFHCCFSSSRSNARQQAGIEWGRNQVFRTEFKFLTVSGNHFFSYLFHRQISQSVHAGAFHFFVDGGRADIQCATEDEWEAQIRCSLDSGSLNGRYR